MHINELLQTTLDHNASDLHLSSGVPPIIRVDGDLQYLSSVPLTDAELRTMVDTILNEQQQQILAKVWEIDLAYALQSKARFRINVFHQERGISAAFRPIPSKVPTLDELECPAIFKNFCELPNGLVLVTGPTGSGKSTTLAAMVNHINQHHEKHVITIEDPIEFTHTSQKCLINQRAVHIDTKGFDVALRSALREDPDVILVGEMRDLETMRLALTAAETGHLVFATLHTSSAAKTIDRVIDVFPGEEKGMIRMMFSESLQAVVAQTLIKRIQNGRIAAFEVMVCTPAVRNLIRESKTAQIYSAIQTGKSSGMCTLEQYRKDLAAQNKILL